ncbi:MAG TPA: 3-dehydroquinate synthase [Leptospiraceae bacterium]|nr:3-dehydroquinate synthase [Leptospiraceae bacterium]
MLSEQIIQLQDISYPIILNTDFSGIEKVISGIKDVSSIYMISEGIPAEKYFPQLKAHLGKYGISAGLIQIRGREKNKHIRQTPEVYNSLIRNGSDRKTLILALGGGVTGDFSGFIAATFQRGIRFAQIPTTLLACVDSSVGGKVAVNADLGKNMIGAFHQPEFVFAPLSVQSTLPEKEWRCGFAEVLKHSLLEGGNFLDKILSIPKKDRKSIDNTIYYIRESVRFKAAVVEQDPKEKGLRAVLNLGHTMGHAVESFLNYKKLSHGEAVSAGMITALILSEMRFGLSKEIRDSVLKLMKRLQLPYSLPLSGEEAFENMKFDKKNQNGKIRYVLLKNPGEPVYNEIIEFDEIQRAVEIQNSLR